MKNGLKIGVVALAMLATVATLATTGKVEAGTNEVQVVIGEYNSGQNTCTGSDYYYYFTASTAVQTGEINTGSISCKFGNMSGQAVTLKLDGALTLQSNSSVSIPAENVLFTNGNWSSNPSDVLPDANQPIVAADSTITTPTTIFNKSNNSIGDARTDNITIKVVVPAGKPNGTYQGTLTLSYAG